MSTLKTYSPIDGRLIVERPLAQEQEIVQALARARQAQSQWKRVPVTERVAICRRFADWMLARKEELGRELTLQMGRPIRYTANEIGGLAERSSYMCDIAAESLATIELPPKHGFERFIRRDPLGVVFQIAPWNYPYLTAVNCTVPAILAGNALILRHSSQTPLCAERMGEAFQAAGLPDGVFQYLHMSVDDTDRVLRSPDIDFVAFTGSVEVGRSVQKAASDHFIGVGLELGGKDPAYVRADADLPFSIENLVDGAFFNSGQSCCGIERIYVHRDVYDRFVAGAVEVTNEYRLGDPMNPVTTLGPMVRASAANFVREQIDEAIQLGARSLIDESRFPLSQPDTPYLAPQILIDVDHSMSVMKDESFGPVVGIMKVDSDEQAIELMNDSPFGLTASIWTTDVEAALRIGGEVETGTWFMNRCDYLDPALAWTGVKDTGRGCTLSKVGFEQLTRPKSFHLKLR
ncbi:MAG: aldehyde dehydrogenase family protein [Fimbriimonas sp.]|nr:aldehyde dehydrogenase family protein [Fimbriimonas sp.]